MSVDPFCNELSLSKADYVKAAIGTVFLIPLRAMAILVVLGVAWVMAWIGLRGEHEVWRTVTFIFDMTHLGLCSTIVIFFRTSTVSPAPAGVACCSSSTRTWA